MCHSVMHIVMSESSVPGVLMCHVLRSWKVVCVILSYVVCLLVSCALNYLKFESSVPEVLMCDVIRSWNVVCVIL